MVICAISKYTCVSPSLPPLQRPHWRRSLQETNGGRHCTAVLYYTILQYSENYTAVLYYTYTMYTARPGPTSPCCPTAPHPFPAAVYLHKVMTKGAHKCGTKFGRRIEICWILPFLKVQWREGSRRQTRCHTGRLRCASPHCPPQTILGKQSVVKKILGEILAMNVCSSNALLKLKKQRPIYPVEPFLPQNIQFLKILKSLVF